MIAFLSGEVLFSENNKLIIKTKNDIGYEVFFSNSVVPGTALEIYITQIVRENDISLYGFKNYNEKKIFELLLSVNGVGPKSAYALICDVGPDEVLDAITFENQETLKKANGIGKKAASQIILSLKDKVAKSVTAKSIRTHLSKENISVDREIFDDALLALQTLGYKENAIIPLLKNNIENCKTSEDLIKIALKRIR